jgi:hypothetical protein
MPELMSSGSLASFEINDSSIEHFTVRIYDPHAHPDHGPSAADLTEEDTLAGRAKLSSVRKPTLPGASLRSSGAVHSAGTGIGNLTFFDKQEASNVAKRRCAGGLAPHTDERHTK